MTKRFNNVGSYLYDNDEPIGSYNDVKVRDDVTDLLNLLSEKNEQLKSRIKDYDVALKKLQDLTDKKLKENEQLKCKIELLKNEIDMLNGDKVMWND